MMPQQRPIASNTSSAFQPATRSFYRMKMQELLGKIQALSGNKYVDQDPERVAYIQYEINKTQSMIFFPKENNNLCKRCDKYV